MDGTYTATVDRIADGETAVVLLEADGDTVDQFDVDVTTLPEAGQHEGAVLEVVVENGAFHDAEYLPEETRSRAESAQERLDRLSSRLSDRD